MSDQALIPEMLGQIRRTFYAKTLEKQFFQERHFLLLAIAFPAKHLNERYGVKAPDSVYRKALKTVIEAIVTKGNRAKIERFSAYFLHCVQERMAHHGEEYYEDAKASMRASESLPAVMRQVRVGEMHRTADVLIELDRTLRSKAGRKKQQPAAQPLLF